MTDTAHATLHSADITYELTSLDEGKLDGGEARDADVDDGGDEARQDADEEHDDPARQLDPPYVLPGTHTHRQ